MPRNTEQQKLFKTFLQRFSFLIALFALSLLFNSCATKPIESTHTIEKIIEHHTDSVKTTAINKAIIDSLIIQIAKVKTAKPECDSITQATIDQLLKQLNSRKKSGDNEVGIYYDDLKKAIITWNKIGETQSVNTTVNKQNKSTNTEKEIVKVPVKYIPLWVKILAWIGFGFLVYAVWRIVRIFI